MPTDTVSDERAPFFVTKMAPVNDLEDPTLPSVMVKNGSNHKSPSSRAAAVAITTMLGITGITATAFTFRQHFINSSSISNKIEKDVLGELVELSVGNSQCIVATGTFNHKISKQFGNTCGSDRGLEPFQTCYQYANNDAKYCWTTSVYHDSCNKACKPVDSSTDGGWHFVPWYYVNPHQTCGEPCTEFEKNTYVHPSAISSFD